MYSIHKRHQFLLTILAFISVSLGFALSPVIYNEEGTVLNKDQDFRGVGERSAMVSVPFNSGSTWYEQSFVVPNLTADFLLEETLNRLHLNTDELAAGRTFGTLVKGEVLFIKLNLILII